MPQPRLSSVASPTRTLDRPDDALIFSPGMGGDGSAKPSIGIALGGGGARGWAHIGVLRALEDIGVCPRVVTGTSIGAAVGAVFAAGRLDAFEAWARSLDRRAIVGLFDLSLQGGLIQASRVFDELQDILPDVDIEDLGLPFGAVATDLERGTEVWLRSGSLRDAVRASIAIPGLIQPKRIQGRWLVDGGLLDPCPVRLCRALGAEVVIAVELSATKALSPALAEVMETHDTPIIEEPPPPEPQEGPKPSSDFYETLSELSDRLWKQLRPAEAPPPEPKPSVYEVIGQSLQIMQTRITRSLMAGDPPELHIVPRLQNVGLMDFDRAADAIEEGARAVRVALTAQADFRRPELESKTSEPS